MKMTVVKTPDMCTRIKSHPTLFLKGYLKSTQMTVAREQKKYLVSFHILCYIRTCNSSRESGAAVKSAVNGALSLSQDKTPVAQKGH